MNTYLKIIICTFIFLTGVSAIYSTAEAQINREGSFGAGVILGEPTGISLKLWTSSSTAMVGGIAWSFSGKSSMHLHTDYVWHNFSLAEVEEGTLGFYYGVGARVLLSGDDSTLGVRIPLGINYIFSGAPLELFAEIVPIFDLIPDTKFNGNGGLGLRFFF